MYLCPLYLVQNPYVYLYLIIGYQCVLSFIRFIIGKTVDRGLNSNRLKPDCEKN